MVNDWYHNGDMTKCESVTTFQTIGTIGNRFGFLCYLGPK